MRGRGLGVVALVFGIGFIAGGLILLADNNVKCNGRIMHADSTCQHVSRRGVAWTNDYAQEKSGGPTAGIILAAVGAVLLLGGAGLVYDSRTRRPGVTSGAGTANLIPPVPGHVPTPPYPPSGTRIVAEPPSPLVSDGFTQPVELRCVLNADDVVRSTVPQLVVQAFAVWLLAALALGLAAPDVTIVWLGGSIAVSAASVAWVYTRKRDRLRNTYGHLQKLILHPGGLRRFDASVVIDIPWTGITRFEWRNSSLPPGARVRTVSMMAGAANAASDSAHTRMGWGIVGQGTVTPLPGASKRLLQLQDSLYHSQLAQGFPHPSPNCLIFPAEFETDWTSGTVGSWLRHYRPDLALPTALG